MYGLQRRCPNVVEVAAGIARQLLAPFGVLQEVDVLIDARRDGWDVHVVRKYPGIERRLKVRRYVDARPFVAARGVEEDLRRLYVAIADDIDVLFDERLSSFAAPSD